MLIARVGGDLRPAARGLEGTCPGCGHDVFAAQGKRSEAYFWAHSGRVACPHILTGRSTWRERWQSLAPLEARDCRILGVRPALLSPDGFAVELVTPETPRSGGQGDPWRLLEEPGLAGKRAAIVDWRDASGYVVKDRNYLDRFGSLRESAPAPVFDVREGWDPSRRTAPRGLMRLPSEPLIATAPLPTVIDFGPRSTIALRVAGTASGQGDRGPAYAINRRWLAEHVALVMYGATEPHACIADRDWDGRMPATYTPTYGGQVYAKPDPQLVLPV